MRKVGNWKLNLLSRVIFDKYTSREFFFLPYSKTRIDLQHKLFRSKKFRDLLKIYSELSRAYLGKNVIAILGHF